MGHSHSHNHISGKNIGITILLNIFISVIQFIGGIISGSISLLSDATHNFSDVLSLVLSYFTNKLSHKPKNSIFTFGYSRAEILSALFNSVTLVVIAVLLIVEAIKRLSEPKIIEPDIVIYFALASIVINILSVALLHKDAKNNLNIKSSYLHLLTDVLTSVAVMIGGIIMKYTDFFLIDSILSILIAVYLMYSGFTIIKETIQILMQATPKNLNLADIKNQILSIKNIDDVENIHLWQLNEHEKYFEAIIILDNNIYLKEFERITQKVSEILHKHEISNIYLTPKTAML